MSRIFGVPVASVYPHYVTKVTKKGRTEDELVAADQEPFITAARAAGFDVTTDLRPGEHEWGLWDSMIREVIDWLPHRG